MLNFIKNKFTAKDKPATEDDDNTVIQQKGFFSRLKSGLLRTRKQFTSQLSNLFVGKKTIDSKLLTELEKILITADVGLETTTTIITHLTKQLEKKELKDPEALAHALKNYLQEILINQEKPMPELNTTKPFVLLMVGVNGAGKTTTIGKITKQLQSQGKKVLLAAGDTFRAAAIEQLKAWGDQNNTPVIYQHTGADSASVIYDAFQAAQARNYDVVIADTAGRLHTQDNLMEELKKIVRILKKLDSSAPHEVMLVLDASVGQNALNQAQKFHEMITISGITVTKLDGTAKGGILFAIANKLNIPIRYIGIGEGIDDLRPFNARNFVDALFETTESDTEEKVLANQ